MRKAVEHSAAADRHAQASKTIKAQLDASVYDDDPDAIDRLRTRIAEREAKRERIKQFNRSRPNLGANINRDRKRLARLERQAESA